MKFSRRHLLLAVTAISLTCSLPSYAGNLPHVLLKTSVGNIELELNQDKAPVSVDNFLQYVKSGQYNGTIFHRVIENFMIQGGGFDKNMNEKTVRGPIKNEASNGLRNDAYTIAMARTANPNSATAQFFINTKDNAFLNYPGQDGWGYAVFGKVVKGKDVVDKIKQVPTGNHGFYQNVPRTPVVIESATIVE